MNTESKPWRLAETIVVCVEVADGQPDIKLLAWYLDRTERSVRAKVGNLQHAFDGAGGLSHNKKRDRAVVAMFKADPAGMSEVAHLLKVVLAQGRRD